MMVEALGERLETPIPKKGRHRHTDGEDWSA